MQVRCSSAALSCRVCFGRWLKGADGIASQHRVVVYLITGEFGINLVWRGKRMRGNQSDIFIFVIIVQSTWQADRIADAAEVFGS